MLRPVAAALLFAGCAHSKDSEDSAVEPVVVDWPVAVPLGGCSYAHTAVLTLGGQQVHVLIDSGSSTTGVSAKGCSTCEDDGVVALYDPATGDDQDQSVFQAYGFTGQANWHGEVYADDAELDGIPAVSFRFGAVDEETYMFYDGSCDSEDGVVDSPIDGILGFAGDGGLQRGTDSYLSNLVAQYDAPDSYALRYCHLGGTMWIGGYDPAQTAGDMQYADMSYPGYGEYVDVADFSVADADGTAVTAPASSTAPTLAGLIDSGGPTMFLPDDAHDVIAAAIAADPDFVTVFGDVSFFDYGHGGVSTTIAPEEIDAALPWLTIDLAGGATLSVPPTTSYLEAFAQGGDHYGYLSNFYADSLVEEALAEEGYDVDLADFLDLGNVPMYTYVVYADNETDQVGFAPGAACP